MKIISPLFSLSHTPKEGPGLLESSSYKKRRITFSRRRESFGLFFGRARGVNNIIFATLSERWKRERARADRARDEWMNAIALSLISKRETKTRARVCVSHRNVPNDNKRMTIAGGALFLCVKCVFFRNFSCGGQSILGVKRHFTKTRKAYTYTGLWKTIHMCINKRGIYMTTLAHSAVCSHHHLLLLIRTTNYTTRRAKKKFSPVLSLSLKYPSRSLARPEDQKHRVFLTWRGKCTRRCFLWWTRPRICS